MLDISEVLDNCTRISGISGLSYTYLCIDIDVCFSRTIDFLER